MPDGWWMWQLSSAFTSHSLPNLKSARIFGRDADTSSYLHPMTQDSSVTCEFCQVSSVQSCAVHESASSA